MSSVFELTGNGRYPLNSYLCLLFYNLMSISYIRKQAYIYAFNSFSTTEDYENYDFQFGTIIDSFKNLTNKKYLNRKPQRIKIIRANGRNTLRNYFQQAQIKKDLWPRFAIMNGMDLGEFPKRDTLIKVL